MKVAVFGAKTYDKKYFDCANQDIHHELHYFDAHLNAMTAPLALGFEAVCVFVNDQLCHECLQILAEGGTKLVALRCAGFNNVDLKAAKSLNLTVVRVPEYSAHGVAEHAVALILALNRKTHKAYNRVREHNFSLDGLLGFNVNEKVIGVIGTGKIGAVFCNIMLGFGCSVIAYDLIPNQSCKDAGVNYVDLKTLLTTSDIISLHCPLTPETHHLIDDDTIQLMKPGIMLINTSRGALIDTVAVTKALKSKKIGYLGLDVYEEEADLFFEDISEEILDDDIFANLLTYPNVLITGHQAFFTHDALVTIASTTLDNITCIENSNPCLNIVAAPT